MPTSTYVALATTTLPSSTASVTFSSIPATYRDLVMVVVGKSNSNQRAFYIRFNGAAAESNTSGIYVANNTSYTDTGMYFLTDDALFSSIINVMDYSATDKHKTILHRDNNDASVWMGAGKWASTAAINQITIDRSGYTLEAGTTVSLYGIEA